MATAGANFDNVQEAGEIYDKWLKFVDYNKTKVLPFTQEAFS